MAFPRLYLQRPDDSRQNISIHEENHAPLGPADSPQREPAETSFIDVEPTSLSWQNLSFSVPQVIKDDAHKKVQIVTNGYCIESTHVE